MAFHFVRLLPEVHAKKAKYCFTFFYYQKNKINCNSNKQEIFSSAALGLIAHNPWLKPNIFIINTIRAKEIAN